MKRLQFCLAVFAVLALTFSAFAQVQNGQFSGTVTDPTGAAIANAKVTVINPATNLSASVTTNSSGNYTARELPPGTYKVTVEAAGFKTTSDNNVVLGAGVIAHVDFKLQIGKATEVVEVTGAAVAVQTDDAKLYTTIGSSVIDNTVLSGRDIFDLMQMTAGAVNVSGTDFENGHDTVVNGVREDFNGFLINGVSNKGLSGGEESTPINDTVEEFQQLGLNMSAQYGNSAGSTVNLVTKSGTNALHGSLFEYLRNEDADANEYFLNAVPAARPPYRWNQFGGTLGGPIVKDKLFFFLAYEKSDFKTSSSSTVTQESQAWRDAVLQADNNQDGNTGPYSVAAALYGAYAPKLPGTPLGTVDQYITGTGPYLNSGGASGTTSGFASYADYICPDSYGPAGLGGTMAQANALATRMQAIIGVVPAVDSIVKLATTGATCQAPLTAQLGTIGRDPTSGVSNMDYQDSSAASFGAQAQGNFFNGRRMSGRLDYNWNTNNRIAANFQWQRNSDIYGPCSPACDRGFTNPETIRSPNAQFSFIHTFSPTILNEFKAGYVQNVALIGTGTPGVPLVAFDDASLGFGSYNGYPQYFRENIYTYADMVSVNHGNHNMKIGVDFRRNIENSQFSVARGSYYFSDPIFFAADAPYGVAAGVNPEICAPPCSQSTIQALVATGVPPSAELSSNVRHWRNLEMGAYFQDDWKATKRLTLQLGLRWDLYVRHNEEANTATTFILGPGSNIIQQLVNANVAAGSTGTIGGVNYDCETNLAAAAMAQVQGVCGPGGFAPASSLGKGRHKDFGPRVGFAWDVFGDGKTSMRGGFGISFEGTLYNPLSNSRWNLPYYSFNDVNNFLSNGGGQDSVIWGPASCTGGAFPNNCAPTGGAQFGPGGTPVTYSGAATNPGQGVGAQATGNINGWNGQNPNLAELTGIIFPQGVDDPYVYNYYLGFQREIMPKTVLEVDFVGTTGHKLFRAENINRAPGTLLPFGSSIVNNVGETLTGGLYSAPGKYNRPNINYGTMRVWENVVNSNYNSLQASLKRQMSHGLLVNVNYTWSHSIDNGSTWHSGATTSNGAAGGDGYTTDPTNPEFDRGNSIYDIRQRLVVNHVWQLPGYNLKGAAGAIAGGWALSGIWSFQSGAHWQPYRSGGPNLRGISGADAGLHCTAADVNSGNCENLGGDYLLTRGRNERPDSSVPHFGDFSRSTWENGWSGGGQTNLPVLTAPCLGCLGNLGRNQFVGPGYWSADTTLSKSFKLTERFTLKFDAAAFNLFNRANFVLATAGAGAHNEIRDPAFGEAGGDKVGNIGPRTMQFGLKLSF